MSSHRIVIVSALVLLIGGCSMLPKSLTSGGHEPAAAAPGVPTAVTGAGPMPPAPVQSSGVKVYPGTGVFLNAKPIAPPPPPGPEEVSLNFESADVREVAKAILGDYLKESYTVHPAVTGTVTFRTVKPIPLKDLLPTLEMLVRQNNAAVVREEGFYKI